MPGLFDHIRSQLATDDALDNLRRRHGIDSAERTATGLELAFPLVISSLSHWAGDAGPNLFVYLRSLAGSVGEVEDFLDPAPVVRPDDTQARRLLGRKLGPAVTAIAVEAGMDPESSSGLIRTVTGVSLASLVASHGRQADGDQLIDALRDERAALVDAGWEPWIGCVEGDAPPIEPEDVPTPLNGGRTGSRRIASAGRDRPRDTAAAAASGASIDATDTEPGGPAPRRMRTPMIAAGVAALAVVGIGLGVALSGGSDTDDDVAATGSTAGDAPASTTEPDEGAGDDDAGPESADSETTATGEQEIVTLSVPLSDTAGAAPDANGLAELELNTATGEICYSIEAENIDGPFATHLHVGATDVDGGLVVDFGPTESPATGCVDNQPVDTNDILAHQGGHYIDLHDVGGELAIRGQLADEEGDADAPDLAFVDPDGGGASAVVEPGRLVLRGEVGDRDTADRLARQYAALDLAGIQVVDELTVVDGAPAPSGRVVLRDGIVFDVGSDRLSAESGAVVDVLTQLALAQPDSVGTIVGHTDDTGLPTANLELSLRRATAIRDRMVAAGVPPERLRIEGAGDTDPIADNGTAAGRAQNRRIEFELRQGVPEPSPTTTEPPPNQE